MEAKVKKRPSDKEAQEVIDDLPKLLEVLPPHLRETLEKEPDLQDLVEVVEDLGRQPEARFFDRVVYLDDLAVTSQDLDYVTSRVGAFSGDNRAGIERTLHRISAIRNRRQEIIGLTCRVGRAVTGTVDIIRDVIETGESLLLWGRLVLERRRFFEKRPVCWRMNLVNGWWLSTPPTRLRVMATFLIPVLGGRVACRSCPRNCSIG